MSYYWHYRLLINQLNLHKTPLQPQHNKRTRRDTRQGAAAGASSAWPLGQQSHVLCALGHLPLEATSHPGMWDAHRLVSSRSKAGDPPIRDTTAQTRSTPAHPHFPAGRGVPGEAGGFCTLEPALRHSGAWKGRRGRCSDCAASSGSGDELFAEPAAQCMQAISGRASVEKSHLEKGGSGAASLGAAGLAPGSGGSRGL